MRHGVIVPGAGLEPPSAGAERSRAGRPRTRWLTPGRIALLLSAAIGVPWLADRERPLQGPPMHRAGGGRGLVFWGLAFSPDGRTIAAVDERGRLWLRPIVEGGDPARVLDVPGFTKVMVFSPDGRYLAVGQKKSDVVLFDLDRGGQGRLLRIPVVDAGSLSFSPDGRTLAVSGAGSPEVILWDIEAGRSQMILRGHSAPVTSVAFGPDGRSLASVAIPPYADDHAPLVLIWDPSTGRSRARSKEPGAFTCAFSPDGRLMAFDNTAMKMIQVRDMQSGRPVGTIIVTPAPIRSIAISNDARLLATTSIDCWVSVWSVATGREIYRLDGQADVLRNLAFSPDGKSLAATGNDGDIRVWDLGGAIADGPRL